MMFSTSSPTYPASVRVVASAITNGTLSSRASVWASSVLPEPVGPISRMLLLASSISSFLPRLLRRLYWLYTATDRIFFACSCPITYWSRISRISRGTGRSERAPLPPVSLWLSSRMMSLHSSMHSSQMNTEGPAMSLRTSCWLLPQNEQYSSLSPEDLSAIQCALRWRGEETLRALPTTLQDLVDDAVLAGLLGPEEVVAVVVGLDLLLRPPRELGHQR